MFQLKMNIDGNRAKNILGSLTFGMLGSFVFYASQDFESAGRVTPAFIGCGLMVLSVLLVLVEFCKPELLPPPTAITGSLVRRSLFIALMAIWVVALPYLGFLVAGCLAFAIISAAVPKNSNKTSAYVALNTVAGVLTTIGFWVVLKAFLKVPLPEATFF